MHNQPIAFQAPAAEAAAFILPNPGELFSARADRLAVLAMNHSLGDWLLFLAGLSRAQDAALQALPSLALPAAATLEQARQHAMPLIDPMQRPGLWRETLRQIVRQVGADAPPAARETLTSLLNASDEVLDSLADTLLTGTPSADQNARLPFVAAALQVVYSKFASQLDAAQLQALDVHGVCPCCGSLPVASVVRLGATINNLRYLHCALCNTEWNVTRATCTACDTDKGVALLEIEGSTGAVRAETCDSCKNYLKIVYQEKDPHVDPVADDLATLALDMLVDQAGYSRAGPNLLLIGAYSD
jgi:FdhE protein